MNTTLFILLPLACTALAAPALRPAIPDEPALSAKADAGDMQACARYGKLLCEQAMNLTNPSHGMEARFLQGIGYLEKAANSGDAESVLLLSIVCTGIDKNKSAYWARKAADAGEPKGHIMLAKLSSDKKQAAEHTARAVELAKARADKDHQDDWLYLYEIYSSDHSDIGIPRDPALANHYLQLAADAGNNTARAILGPETVFRQTEEEQARHIDYLRTHPGIAGGNGLTEETTLDFGTATPPVDEAVASYLQTVYPGAKKTGPVIKRPGRNKPTLHITSYLLPDGRVLQLHIKYPAQPQLPRQSP